MAEEVGFEPTSLPNKNVNGFRKIGKLTWFTAYSVSSIKWISPFLESQTTSYFVPLPPAGSSASINFPLLIVPRWRSSFAHDSFDIATVFETYVLPLPDPDLRPALLRDPPCVVVFFILRSPKDWSHRVIVRAKIFKPAAICVDFCF